MNPSCQHFWDIAELPVDGRFLGRCRYCGRERDWPAELQDAMTGYRDRGNEARVRWTRAQRVA